MVKLETLKIDLTKQSSKDKAGKEGERKKASILNKSKK